MQPKSAADIFFDWWTLELGRTADYSAEYEAARDAWLTATAYARDTSKPKDRLEFGVAYEVNSRPDPKKAGHPVIITDRDNGFTMHIYAVRMEDKGETGVNISVFYPEDDPRDPTYCSSLRIPFEDEPADGEEDDYNLGLCPQEPGDVACVYGLSDDQEALESVYGPEE